MEIQLTLAVADFDDLTPDEQKSVYIDALWPIIHANEAYLRRHPECPRLYESGVRFFISRAELLGRGNRAPNIPIILAEGRAHCIGLSAWRVAELRVRDGIDARPGVFKFSSNRPPVGLVWEFHVVVLLPGGKKEDPSQVLGMPTTAQGMDAMVAAG